jgi:hypothetical protein
MQSPELPFSGKEKASKVINRQIQACRKAGEKQPGSKIKRECKLPVPGPMYKVVRFLAYWQRFF